jgi:hypothetical protein
MLLYTVMQTVPARPDKYFVIILYAFKAAWHAAAAVDENEADGFHHLQQPVAELQAIW